MRRLLPALAALAFFAGASPSAAQVFIIASCGTVPAAQATLTAGNSGETFVDTAGRLCVAATQASQYPSGATPITAASGNVAAGTATATLAAVAAKTTFICGFSITSAGSTAAAVVSPTVTGTITGTLTFTYVSVAGVTLANQPLVVPFSPCVPASAVNTTIPVALPSLGAGNTNATVNAWGYQL